MKKEKYMISLKLKLPLDNTDSHL